MNESRCLVCPHVFADERPVELLIHHDDGTWQAVCGKRDHALDPPDFIVVGVNHLFDRQTNLACLRNLRLGEIAEWSGALWTIGLFDEEGSD